MAKSEFIQYYEDLTAKYAAEREKKDRRLQTMDWNFPAYIGPTPVRYQDREVFESTLQYYEQLLAHLELRALSTLTYWSCRQNSRIIERYSCLNGVCGINVHETLVLSEE